VENVAAATSDFDVTHPLFGATVVFTGTLESMPRRQAAQLVVDSGGRCSSSVTTETNLLVVGIQDLRTFRDGETRSSKMRKAEVVLSKGGEIEIVSEDEFLKLTSEE